MSVLRYIFPCLFVIVAVLSTAQARAATLHVGAASSDITPDMPSFLAGQFSPRVSQEVESNRLLSSDYWGPTREMLKEISGQDVTIVGLCGAAGDQSPHLRYRQAADDRMRSLRKVDRLQEIARRIVHGVDEAYEVVQTAKQDDVVVKHHRPSSIFRCAS